MKGSPACTKAESNLEEGIRKHVSFAAGDGIISPSHAVALQPQTSDEAEESANGLRKPLSLGDDSSMDPDSSIAHDPRAIALHSVAVQDELSEPLARSGSGSRGAAHPHITTSMTWNGEMSTHVDED